MPHVAVRATLGYTGKTGCSRSNAWIWLTWEFVQDVQMGLQSGEYRKCGRMPVF